MLDSWTFLDAPVVYATIFAITVPFLLLLFFTKIAACWTRRQTTTVPSVESIRRERATVIGRDEEFVQIVSTLSHLEKFNPSQKSITSIKNKTRLMLRLRKRVMILFPEMNKEEIEEFCGHIYDLTKCVAHKKNR